MLIFKFLQVDLGKVAEVMGYNSVGSVGNRFRLLRKRYRLNLECKNTTVKGKNGSDRSESTAVVVDNDHNSVNSGGPSKKRKIAPKKTPTKGKKKPALEQNALSAGSGDVKEERISPALLEAVDMAATKQNE